MAPIIPTVALAPERKDDHAKPVRPPRGGKSRPKQKSGSLSGPSGEAAWLSTDEAGDQWEDFQ